MLNGVEFEVMDFLIVDESRWEIFRRKVKVIYVLFFVPPEEIAEARSSKATCQQMQQA